MPDFKMMSYGELQKHLEDRGFSISINDTWQDLYDAATADWEIEERQR